MKYNFTHLFFFSKNFFVHSILDCVCELMCENICVFMLCVYVGEIVRACLRTCLRTHASWMSVFEVCVGAYKYFSLCAMRQDRQWSESECEWYVFSRRRLIYRYIWLISGQLLFRAKSQARTKIPYLEISTPVPMMDTLAGVVNSVKSLAASNLARTFILMLTQRKYTRGCQRKMLTRIKFNNGECLDVTL